MELSECISSECGQPACSATSTSLTEFEEFLLPSLWNVLESGNAKCRVNVSCSVCARCGDEVLCGAGTPFLDVCK